MELPTIVPSPALAAIAPLAAPPTFEPKRPFAISIMKSPVFVTRSTLPKITNIKRYVAATFKPVPNRPSLV